MTIAYTDAEIQPNLGQAFRYGIPNSIQTEKLEDASAQGSTRTRICSTASQGIVGTCLPLRRNELRQTALLCIDRRQAPRMQTNQTSLVASPSKSGARISVPQRQLLVNYSSRQDTNKSALPSHRLYFSCCVVTQEARRNEAVHIPKDRRLVWPQMLLANTLQRASHRKTSFQIIT